MASGSPNIYGPKQNFWQRHYRPLIYLLTLVCVVGGTLTRLPLSLSVSDATQGVFDTLEKLPELRAQDIEKQQALLAEKLEEAKTNSGPDLQKEIAAIKDKIARLQMNPKGVVLVCIDFDPSTEAELGPMAHAFIRHCFSRGVKVLVNTGGNVMSQPLAQNIISASATEGALMKKNKYDFMEDGTDYVFFGFRPNAFQLYLQMGENILTAYETDYAGHDLTLLPIMRGIRNFSDIDMVFSISGYVGSPETWITVGNTKFGKPVALGQVAISASDYYPYIQSKQICGMLPGLRGAAEYEGACGSPPRATGRMWAQLYTHTFAILLIIIGNLEFFFKGFKHRKV
ncbi:hypothetical protein IKS73_02260 [bacterium]|nr:hypothetical protein [bacterium]